MNIFYFLVEQISNLDSHEPDSVKLKVNLFFFKLNNVNSLKCYYNIYRVQICLVQMQVKKIK